MFQPDQATHDVVAADRFPPQPVDVDQALLVVIQGRRVAQRIHLGDQQGAVVGVGHLSLAGPVGHGQDASLVVVGDRRVDGAGLGTDVRVLIDARQAARAVVGEASHRVAVDVDLADQLHRVDQGVVEVDDVRPH